MEVPLLHNDALQWTVVAVPPAAPVPLHPPPPCCPAPRNVAGGATPASSSSAPASTIVWFVPCRMLLFGFITCIAQMVTVSQLLMSVSWLLSATMDTVWLLQASMQYIYHCLAFGNSRTVILRSNSEVHMAIIAIACCTRFLRLFIQSVEWPSEDLQKFWHGQIYCILTCSIHIISMPVFFVFCAMRLFTLHCWIWNYFLNYFCTSNFFYAVMKPFECCNRHFNVYLLEIGECKFPDPMGRVHTTIIEIVSFHKQPCHLHLELKKTCIPKVWFWRWSQSFK